MNEGHAKLCASPEWQEHMQTEVLPRVTTDVELGAEMLEVGPGPGATTDWLHQRVERLRVVELEAEAAARLRTRFAGTNVEVVHGDAARMAFPDDSFDSAGCFTMLHHIPTVALQNRLLAEIRRVLRPGGVLVGADSLPSTQLHEFHVDDVYNPVEPGTFLVRLQTLGYVDITIGVDQAMRFTAHKPSEP
jgi:ubiquinone/menaquinone biosynthesis C-methylase UbiE